MMTVPDRANDPGIIISQEIQKRAPGGNDDRSIEAPVPRLDFSFHQNHFGFGIHVHELRGESNGWRIRGYRAEAAEESIPFTPRENVALAEKLGVLRGVPGNAVSAVGEELDRMVAGQAQNVENILQR